MTQQQKERYYDVVDKLQDMQVYACKHQDIQCEFEFLQREDYWVIKFALYLHRNIDTFAIAYEYIYSHNTDEEIEDALSRLLSSVTKLGNK